jgi:hypothetical protein
VRCEGSSLSESRVTLGPLDRSIQPGRSLYRGFSPASESKFVWPTILNLLRCDFDTLVRVLLLQLVRHELVNILG